MKIVLGLSQFKKEKPKKEVKEFGTQCISVAEAIT